MKKSNGFKMYIDISGIFMELLVYVVVILSFQFSCLRSCRKTSEDQHVLEETYVFTVSPISSLLVRVSRYMFYQV